MNQDGLNSLYGGLVIGIAVSLLLLLNGRIAGISGILSGFFTKDKSDRTWRVCFLMGLFIGGVVLKLLSPNIFGETSQVSNLSLILAGLCVGAGTAISGGCTSGHGVCGISRLSLRSIIATCVFIITGILFVFLRNYFGFSL